MMEPCPSGISSTHIPFLNLPIFIEAQPTSKCPPNFHPKFHNKHQTLKFHFLRHNLIPTNYSYKILSSKPLKSTVFAFQSQISRPGRAGPTPRDSPSAPNSPLLLPLYTFRLLGSARRNYSRRQTIDRLSFEAPLIN